MWEAIPQAFQALCYTFSVQLVGTSSSLEGRICQIVVYAPPGPEQKLKQLGEHAFDSKK